MFKAGLIVGVVAAVLALLVTLVSPLFVPCLVLLPGLVAGYLASVFDKPVDNGASAKAGALGGLIAGAGAVVGQLGGAAINALFVGPENARQIMENFGIEYGTTAGVETGYWAGLIGSGICMSLVDVVLMAALGALGGILWWQITGKNQAAPPPYAGYPQE